MLNFFKKKKPEENKESVKETFSYDQRLQPIYPQSNNEMQVIISKLDLINARLENLNQRLINLERVLFEEKRKW